MTLRKELKQWIKNYDSLIEPLTIAFKFNNKQEIDSLSKRLITTQRQITEVVMALEKNSNPGANNVIRPSVDTDVNITEYTPLDFDSVDRDSNK